MRIQDVGCAENRLPNKSYTMANIIDMGPPSTILFYYHLAAIAVDYLKSFKIKITLGRGWLKVPTNKTNVKIKIIEIILSLRKMRDSTYQLNHTRLLSMLYTL